MLRLSPTVENKRLNMRAKSGIYICESYFDPSQEVGISVSKISAKRTPSPDVLYHREQANKMRQLQQLVTLAFETADRSTIASDWLKNIVTEILHPKTDDKEEAPAFVQMAEEYKATKDVEQVRKNWDVLVRTILRYEGFVRATQPKRANFVFDVATLTKEDIEDLRDYIANEKQLSEEYPSIFAKLMQQYPPQKAGESVIAERGSNTVYDRMKKLRAFVNWWRKQHGIKNDPFKGAEIGKETYGEPFYIKIDERKKIASTPMPSKHLETQRDVFVFQCLIGCRFGDLEQLTADNIGEEDGYKVLKYTPRKTKDNDNAVIPCVPLLDEALSLIAKYEGADKRGRLFPVISGQQYNKAIKEVLTVAEITRKVEVRNALTGELEFRPINEVASSHMARRSFVGNIYARVQDPALISRMSGHVPGSKAFSRYRKIDVETTSKVLINTIE